MLVVLKSIVCCTCGGGAHVAVRVFELHRDLPGVPGDQSQRRAGDHDLAGWRGNDGDRGAAGESSYSQSRSR